MSGKYPEYSDIHSEYPGTLSPTRESPGLCPDCPRIMFGVSGHIPGVSGYSSTNG
ncbi:hypothetical protein C2845_PM12G25850 [Panicum miliaceum]|uniref:Uncharacterized protein n=1 Tax=Panicum miliaceum TaxID=4540 RepID=A0A3L6QCI4_PANMI|nr:hypothetical protein C2845_PM12G25850 [Panicum miliaceum]